MGLKGTIVSAVGGFLGGAFVVTLYALAWCSENSDLVRVGAFYVLFVVTSSGIVALLLLTWEVHRVLVRRKGVDLVVQRDIPESSKEGHRKVGSSGGATYLPPGNTGGTSSNSEGINQPTSSYCDTARNIDVSKKRRVAGSTIQPEPSHSPIFQPTESPSPKPVPTISSSNPGDLIEAWEAYLRHGDGRFNAKGLERQLEKKGISARVLSAEHLGMWDHVLGVVFDASDGGVYLLPDFTKPPRAVSEVFYSRGDESRRAKIKRLVQPAVARRKSGGWHLEQQGQVE
jgi:hypothetical protein